MVLLGGGTWGVRMIQSQASGKNESRSPKTSGRSYGYAAVFPIPTGPSCFRADRLCRLGREVSVIAPWRRLARAQRPVLLALLALAAGLVGFGTYYWPQRYLHAARDA